MKSKVSKQITFNLIYLYLLLFNFFTLDVFSFHKSATYVAQHTGYGYGPMQNAQIYNFMTNKKCKRFLIFYQEINFLPIYWLALTMYREYFETVSSWYSFSNTISPAPVALVQWSQTSDFLISYIFLQLLVDIMLLGSRSWPTVIFI